MTSFEIFYDAFIGDDTLIQAEFGGRVHYKVNEPNGKRGHIRVVKVGEKLTEFECRGCDGVFGALENHALGDWSDPHCFACVEKITVVCKRCGIRHSKDDNPCKNCLAE